jgi:hypothetical protein
MSGSSSSGSLAQTVRTIAWSFFGVRRRAGHEEDMARLNPLHVIAGGVAGAVLFVLALVLLVRWVVGSGVAA